MVSLRSRRGLVEISKISDEISTRSGRGHFCGVCVAATLCVVPQIVRKREVRVTLTLTTTPTLTLTLILTLTLTLTWAGPWLQVDEHDGGTDCPVRRGADPG